MGTVVVCSKDVKMSNRMLYVYWMGNLLNASHNVCISIFNNYHNLNFPILYGNTTATRFISTRNGHTNLIDYYKITHCDAITSGKSNPNKGLTCLWHTCARSKFILKKKNPAN